MLDRWRAGSLDRRVAQAADLLHASHYTVALTGAGVSTPSGIPDFRSPRSGIWQTVDPQDIASVDAVRRRPEAFYAWVRTLAETVLQAQPNPAHQALARLESLGLLHALITQNIDDLHSRAGSQNVYEVHGSLREVTCLRCYAVMPSATFINAFLETGQVPRCPHCGGVLKPNVVLFDELLPTTTFHRARQSVARCDLMLIAGTSLQVAPVSELPAAALAHGARLIIVNRDKTPYDRQADVIIHGDVATVLPRVLALCDGTAA